MFLYHTRSIFYDLKYKSAESATIDQNITNKIEWVSTRNITKSSFKPVNKIGYYRDSIV